MGQVTGQTTFVGLSSRTMERAVLAALAAFGAAAAAASPSLGIWDANGPASGFFPAVSGVTVSLCALASLFRQEMPGGEAFIADRSGALRVGAVLAAIVAMAVGIPILGFIATSIPVLSLLLIAVNRGRPLYAVLVAAGAAIGIHLLFEGLLDTLLPRGTLGLV